MISNSNKTSLDKSLIKRLREILAADRVSDDPVDLLTYAYDATRREFPPQVVVWPETASEISALFRLACETGIPIYPRGTGTGMSGGALATQGGILLSMERMAEIKTIDKPNRLVTAQPGIKLGDLKTAVQNHDLFFPPDPSSAKTASLGGCLAECAGGLTCVKYGTMKDWVQQVEAVMPTGEIIRVGSKARKSVVGYNLLQLIVGSEGTLAVITEAVLRLIPYPRHRSTFIALFDSVSVSAQAVQTMLDSGVIPCALEYIDRNSLEAAKKFAPDKPIPLADALLLVECDGYNEADVSTESQILADLCRAGGAQAVKAAQSESERLTLWEIRKTLSPAMFAIAPFKTNEDICVPISEFPPMLEEAYAIGKKHNILTLCFGHVGDGNIHVNFMSTKDHDPDVETAVSELFRAVVAHSGAISGEHGIGITKAPYLAYEMNERERRLHLQIKSLFDPHNILNPGKIVIDKF